MIPGTTPTHTFITKIDTSLLTNIKITYKQDNIIVLEKYISECALDKNSIKVKLSQEETLKFDCTKRVKIQLRALSKDGDALATKSREVSISECLDSEVLV